LAAAHAQGLVHRDVKPANILLENGVERAYLTDFGLARAADDASLTYTGVVAGTPHYMSPEQADGQPLDYRSDLFSLGSVLYFMATGHPPFRADRPMAVLKRTCHDPHRPAWECNAEIPDALSSIIDRLLAKNPTRRYASASELQLTLAKVLSDVQQGYLRHHRRPRLRTPLWLGTGGLITVLAVGGMITEWLLNQSRHDAKSEPSVRASQHPAPETQAEASPLTKLLSVDPSPSDQSQDDMDALLRTLHALETAPFPESLFRQQDDSVNPEE
jgi:serine/threonine protein kinase